MKLNLDILKPKPAPLLPMDKAYIINRGFRKIHAFIARGVKLNPIPKRSKVNKSFLCTRPNHLKHKPLYRLLFSPGDSGYQSHPTKIGQTVPKPFKRTIPKRHYKGLSR